MHHMNHHHHPHTLIADFTTGNVNRQLVSFAMPMFLSHLLQIVYNMADMIIVGQTLGKVGLSAISVGGDIMNCMTFIAMGFSSAGQVLIAQYIGAKQHDKLSRFVATMSAALFGFACCVTGIGLLFRREIMELMHTPPEAFAEALSYAGISMAGIIFVYGYNAVSAILRGMGDAKHPFYFISLAALLNIVLDVIFVMQCWMSFLSCSWARAPKARRWPPFSARASASCCVPGSSAKTGTDIIYHLRLRSSSALRKRCSCLC